jgi:hypothetical protein
MRRSKPPSSGAGEGNSDCARSSGVHELLRDDERGIASQFDFLTSIAITVTAVGLFLVAGVTLLSGAGAEVPAGDVAAERGAATLTDDHLVENVGDTQLSRQCTEAFFAKDTSVCGFQSGWTSGDEKYLNQALAIQYRNLNVTITDSSGDITSIDGTRLTLGDDPVNAGNQTVAVWTRHVALDSDDDGEGEYHTLTVRSWK